MRTDLRSDGQSLWNHSGRGRRRRRDIFRANGRRLDVWCPYPFSSGTGPYASLAIDAAGNFYGTTFAGGAYGFGSVFKLTYSGGSWTSSTLHDFIGGNDGANPQSTPVFDTMGNLYGTTRAGGAYGNGTIFQLAP